jgi:hypothetical protein
MATCEFTYAQERESAHCREFGASAQAVRSRAASHAQLAGRCGAARGHVNGWQCPDGQAR